MSPRAARLATTATGLRIGIAHQRPLPAIDREAERLQAALLEPRTARPLLMLQRIVGRVWQWL